MSNIKYILKFYSDWHCGSGLVGGAEVDDLVIKDNEGLPYVPGKTIKGLIRETVVDFLGLTYGKEIPQEKTEAFYKSFGCAGNGSSDIKGSAFFTNAELGSDERKWIKDTHTQKFLYGSQAFVKISETGIAVDHSLREMEKVIPCTLEGEIVDLDEHIVDEVKWGMKAVKRLGADRNRGFGRCEFVVL